MTLTNEELLEIARKREEERVAFLQEAALRALAAGRSYQTNLGAVTGTMIVGGPDWAEAVVADAMHLWRSIEVTRGGK